MHLFCNVCVNLTTSNVLILLLEEQKLLFHYLKNWIWSSALLTIAFSFTYLMHLAEHMQVKRVVNYKHMETENFILAFCDIKSCTSSRCISKIISDEPLLLYTESLNTKMLTF